MLTHSEVLRILGWAAAPADSLGDELGLPVSLLQGDNTVLIVIAVAGLIVAYYLMLMIVHWSRRRGGGRSPLGDAHFLDDVETKGGLTRDEMRRVREAMMRQSLPGAKQPTESKSGGTVQDLARVASLGSVSVNPAQKRQTPPPLPGAHAQDAPMGGGVPRDASATPAKADASPHHVPASLDEILVHHDARGNAQAAAAGGEALTGFPSDSAGHDAGVPPALPTVDLRTQSPRRIAPDLSAPAEPPALPAGGRVSLDLDMLLARGLIGQEEYDRLRALAEWMRSNESGAPENR